MFVFRGSGWIFSAAQEQNYAGIWQDTVSATARTFTVDTSWQLLQINEVLASNADSIELYYDGAGSLDLGGYRITDNYDLPDKCIVAAGTVMNPGDYLVIYARQPLAG